MYVLLMVSRKLERKSFKYILRVLSIFDRFIVIISEFMLLEYFVEQSYIEGSILLFGYIPKRK